MLLALEASLFFVSAKFKSWGHMIFFVGANSEDRDEMPHDAAFHLCLYCLPKGSFRRNQVTMC